MRHVSHGSRLILARHLSQVMNATVVGNQPNHRNLYLLEGGSDCRIGWFEMSGGVCQTRLEHVGASQLRLEL